MLGRLGIRCGVTKFRDGGRCGFRVCGPRKSVDFRSCVMGRGSTCSVSCDFSVISSSVSGFSVGCSGVAPLASVGTLVPPTKSSGHLKFG